MPTQTVRDILEAVAAGTLDAATAQTCLQDEAANTVRTANAAVDVDRKRRCGFAEVVYCDGKSAAVVVEIFEVLLARGQNCLGTQAAQEHFEAVSRQFPDAIMNKTARTIRVERSLLPRIIGQVCVISAGTCDKPVAEEALETLLWMRCDAELIVDVGVAGPQRLHEQLERFEDARAIVVVAGMEGALPSVVGGHVRCPVIAVPTSVGYGASFGGLTALLGMLNSCAANVTVVNINAGFKGGYIAGLIARQASAGESRGAPAK